MLIGSKDEGTAHTSHHLMRCFSWLMMPGGLLVVSALLLAYPARYRLSEPRSISTPHRTHIPREGPGSHDRSERVSNPMSLGLQLFNHFVHARSQKSNKGDRMMRFNPMRARVH
jgi:hypothetical protein